MICVSDCVRGVRSRETLRRREGEKREAVFKI